MVAADDPGKLKQTGQDENIDSETDKKDLKARPEEESGEEAKERQEEPAETAKTEETAESDGEAEPGVGGGSGASGDSDGDAKSTGGDSCAGDSKEISSSEKNSEPDEDDDFADDDYDEDDDFVDDDEDDDYDEDDPDDDSADDEDDPDDDESDERGMGLNLFTLFVLLIAAAITVIYFTCTVRTVHVRGNSLYTGEEIAEQVISDDSQLMHNSVFLTVLYMTPWAPKIPFEESVKVSLNSYDEITITVKDMDIAGFIPYAGKKLYFSADGVVLENSPLTVKGATFVTGLSITGAEIGTKMTSDNEVGLGMVLEVLEILRKFRIETDCVVLTKSGSIVMYMGEIKVMLGRSNFELKISKIAQLIPYLEGRSGTINMTNYTSSDQNIILK